MPRVDARLLFISWAPFCSRSDSIARRLGGKSYMVYSPFWGSNYVTILPKYLSQAVKTLLILFRERPSVVFVMTPPVAVCAPVWLYCALRGASFVIDAHTGAFLDPRWRRFLFLHRCFSRRALTTLVTGEPMQDLVRGWRAPATIVRDVPVIFPEPAPLITKERCTMTLISTFTWDEPLEVFFHAARLVSEVQFYVTGDYQNAAPRVLKQKPNNVALTGFLPDREYVGLVLASDAILCLTTLDHTMQRGAYEAVYLGTPVVTSNFEILRKAFARGAVHVDNTPEDTARGIREMRDNLPRYRQEVQQLRTEKLALWEETRAQLSEIISRRAHNAGPSPSRR